MNDDLQERIDKAIDYILNHELVNEQEHYVISGKELLDILKGSDKEWKNIE